MHTGYLFTFHEFGLEPVLKLLGIKNAIKASAENNKGVIKKISKSDPKEFLLIFLDDEEGIGLLEEFRFKHSIASPVLILSFKTQEKVENNFAKSPRTNKPIINFGKGTYYLQLPFRIDRLRDILKEAAPIDKTDMDNMKAEYEFTVRYKEDADFRHRCANLSSALRILQGAYYLGDMSSDDYKAALEALKLLSWKSPEMRSYTTIIKDYIDNFTPMSQSLQVTEEVDTAPTRVMLLDDEVFTAGWDVVFSAISKKLNFSIDFATDRDKFLSDIESKDGLDFDILLLDLKLPDAPGKSIYLIERMRDKFPDIAVIVFTAINSVRDFEKCKKSGAFEYFIKELGPEDRSPIAYYKKLKWIIGRASELSIEGRKTKESPVRLGDPVFSTIKSSVQVPVSSAEERSIVLEEWNTFFAFSATSVGKATEQTTGEIEEKRERILSWLLKEPSDGRHLSLRYIADPEQQTITIAIIGKTKASTREKSLDGARLMSRNVSFLLGDFSLYNFEPVREQKDLFSILEPFYPDSIVTIQREEIPVEVNGKEFAAVHPYSFNAKTYIDGFLKMALNFEVRTSVNVALWPVTMAKELDDLKREIDSAKVQFETSNPKKEAVTFVEGRGQRVSSRFSVPRKDEMLASRMEAALDTLEGQWRSLKTKDRYLFSRLDLLSEADIPSMMAETLNYDFFGADARVKLVSHAKEQMEKAWNDIKLLNFRRPRRDGKLMVNLVDLLQAKCIFQLPLPKLDGGVPGIKTESLNVIQVPPNVRDDISGENGLLIANGFVKGGIVPIRLKTNDLMKHLYICGRSGSGKSTLLLRLALSLAEKNKGFCMIDPHGDVSLTLRDLIPAKRRKDVIFFNPADPTCDIGFQVLQNDGTDEEQARIYNELYSFFRKIYKQDWTGPVFNRMLKFTLFLAMKAGKTLADIGKLWNDEEFRKSCISKIDRKSETGKEVVNYWENEWPNSLKGDWGKGTNTWFLAKFEEMVTSEVMRRVLSSASRSIDFDDVFNKKKILIARLFKGGVTENVASMLGMIVASRLRDATMKRGAIPEKDREDYYFIIDEFQNFVSSGSPSFTPGDLTFSSLLSEARKFKISLILAHQYISQLGEEMRRAVFGNVQSRIIFGIEAEDAYFIKSQIPTGPAPDSYVLCPNYYAYAQFLLNGEQVGPFTIKTIVPE